jgi:hypothetical protein
MALLIKEDGIEDSDGIPRCNSVEQKETRADPRLKPWVTLLGPSEVQQ